MIKNVIIVNDYDYVQGGASLVAIETANLLSDKGLHVIFFCGISNKEKSLLKKNIEVISTDDFDCMSNPNKIKGILQGVNNRKAYFCMKKLLNSLISEETVVSIHGYTKSLSTSFVKACYESNVKIFLTAHDYFSICPNGGLFNYKKNHICNKQGTLSCYFCNCDSRNFLYKLYRNLRYIIQNRVFKFRDRISSLITISDTNERLLKDYFKFSNIERIYNPTSIDEKKERIKCENNEYFVYVGRTDKEKGLDFVCEEFKKTKSKLIIVGSGNYFDYLVKKYSSDYIIFTGWLSHDKALDYIKKSKALIFSSLLYEGAPLTIFEAQSLGIPCFVSKYSNGCDFIDSECGIVFDPKKDGELSEIINCNPDIKTLSENTYLKYWSNPFTKERYVKDFINLINGGEVVRW